MTALLLILAGGALLVASSSSASPSSAPPAVGSALGELFGVSAGGPVRAPSPVPVQPKELYVQGGGFFGIAPVVESPKAPCCTGCAAGAGCTGPAPLVPVTEPVSSGDAWTSYAIPRPITPSPVLAPLPAPVTIPDYTKPAITTVKLSTAPLAPSPKLTYTEPQKLTVSSTTLSSPLISGVK